MAEASGCAGQAHLANSLRKPLKKHNRTEAHIAPLYPAIVRLCCPASPSAHSMMRRRTPDCERGRGTSSRFRSEEHTSELQSLMRISYAVFCLKKKTQTTKSDINSSRYIIR